MVDWAQNTSYLSLLERDRQTDTDRRTDRKRVRAEDEIRAQLTRAENARRTKAGIKEFWDLNALSKTKGGSMLDRKAKD